MLQRKASVLPMVGLVLAMIIWGSSYIAMKFALQGYDPLVVVFGRMAVATLIFLGCYKKLAGFAYTKGDWKYFLLLALCEPCLYFIFESYALEYTTASQAGMVAAFLPLLVALVAGCFLKERTRPATILGFGIAVGGMLLMTFQSTATESAPNPLLGNSLEFIAMCFAAGYTTASRYLGTRYSALFLTAMQMFGGTLFFAPAAWLARPHLPQDWPLIPSVAMLYLGGGVSVGAYSLYNYGLRKISASQAAAYVNLVPVFAVLFGWLILDERLTLLQSGGMILVFFGVGVSTGNATLRRPRLVPYKS